MKNLPSASLLLGMVGFAGLVCLLASWASADEAGPTADGAATGRAAHMAGIPAIPLIDPPEKGFFAKVLYYHGIPIKAPAVVSDAALEQAYDRLAEEMAHQPHVAANLAAAGAELQIIGKDQVTSDLPEFRALKGKKLSWYGGQTIDERTRGLGGLMTSCGEENLLRLPSDRYRGRDICIHEFAHNIRDHGIPQSVRDLFDAQYRRSLAQGLWHGAYAATNPDEWFAELSMWYFGTHGDLGMTGPKPENGPEGLRKYDPAAYALVDSFYQGRIFVPLTPQARALADRAPHG